jgi:hypothetical protein
MTSEAVGSWRRDKITHPLVGTPRRDFRVRDGVKSHIPQRAGASPPPCIGLRLGRCIYSTQIIGALRSSGPLFSMPKRIALEEVQLTAQKSIFQAFANGHGQHHPEGRQVEMTLVAG